MMTDVCGILLAGGNGTRLFPLTITSNKHLLPVYDKPMIYYPLSTLMMAGIRDIALVTRTQDADLYRKLLGDGSALGISITYLTQDKANGIPEGYILGKKFIGSRNIFQQSPLSQSKMDYEVTIPLQIQLGFLSRYHRMQSWRAITFLFLV